MQTKEYRTIDKSEWIRGEWDNEPDKIQFTDEATGLPCLIARGHSGALCGYVGVSESHPLFGKDYDSARVMNGEGDLDYPEVHGGLTFSNSCYEITRERWEKWRTHIANRSDEAKKYPTGDIANTIKDSLVELENFEAWKVKSEARGVCHVADDGEDKVWWFGFDCAHSGDICPAHTRHGGCFLPSGYETYRTINYVKNEIRSLAAQLATQGHPPMTHREQIAYRDTNDPAIVALVEALKVTQFGFAHSRCPVCAGFNVGPNGETDNVHTPSCPIALALAPWVAKEKV